MKINLIEELKDISGNPIKEQGSEKNVILKDILITALVRGHKQNEDVSEKDLMAERVLSIDIFKNDEIDLKTDDIVKLKNLVRQLIQNVGLNRPVAAEAIAKLESGG